jgi:hypothetical protein
MHASGLPTPLKESQKRFGFTSERIVASAKELPGKAR